MNLYKIFFFCYFYNNIFILKLYHEIYLQKLKNYFFIKYLREFYLNNLNNNIRKLHLNVTFYANLLKFNNFFCFYVSRNH